MRRYSVIPYVGKYTEGKLAQKRPVSFLLAYRNGDERRVKIFEINNMKKPICELPIDFDREKDYFVLTYMDEGYEAFREVLLRHKFPGHYKEDITRAFKFSLREFTI